MRKYKVVYSEKVEKQLERLPENIAKKFIFWVRQVEWQGLPELRKSSGFHDEPLQGNRYGTRSVRLNIAYRLFYRELKSEIITIVEVLEVNKHEY
jgi:proteic killer suppression protein